MHSLLYTILLGFTFVLLLAPFLGGISEKSDFSFRTVTAAMGFTVSAITATIAVVAPCPLPFLPFLFFFWLIALSYETKIDKGLDFNGDLYKN